MRGGQFFSYRAAGRASEIVPDAVPPALAYAAAIAAAPCVPHPRHVPRTKCR